MDVPKHALRPTLLSALERIEALKEARKVDGEKIEMAIKELKESESEMLFGGYICVKTNHTLLACRAAIA